MVKKKTKIKQMFKKFLRKNQRVKKLMQNRQGNLKKKREF